MNEYALNLFCERWIDAWHGNRPELLRSFYSVEAFYRDPHLADGIRGDALLPYFQKLLALNPHWHWKILEIFSHSSLVCVKWQASIPVREKRLTEVGVDILEIRDGLIVRNEVFFDRTTWLKEMI